MVEQAGLPALETQQHRWTQTIGLPLAVGSLVLLAAIIYRPWQATPLPVSDWGGMLPILTGERTLAGRFHGLMDAYMRDGRYQPAVMGAIATTWSAFGADTVAWQWIRFIGMTGVIVGCIVLARRLGANAAAAVAAALLVVVSGMAQQSWILLQLAEPRGTLVMVCGALCAVGYAASERWVARAVAIVTALVVSILYKETFIVAVPFVLALALWARTDGAWVVRVPTKRDIVLIGAAVVAIAIFNVVPILRVRALADASAYSARYDFGSVSLDQLRNVLAAMFLPVTRVWWFPANAAFVTAVAVGLVVGVRRYGRSALVAVGVLLGAILLGTAMYLPWFAVEGYYAFAFLPALVSLFALSLTWLWQSRAKAVRALTLLSCGLVALYGALFSDNYIHGYRALRAAEWRTVRALYGLDGRTLVAAVPSPATSGSFAMGLRGYALGLGIVGVPQGTDVNCGDAAGLVAERAPSIVVMFSTFCATETVRGVVPTRMIRESYVVRDWKTFTRARHEIRVLIWAVDGSSPTVGQRGAAQLRPGREAFPQRS